MSQEEVVALSEQELRLLEQMEQALAAEDPKFASTLRGRSLERTARSRTVFAAIGFVAGLGALLGGAMSQQTWLGILGFVMMLAAATIGLAAWTGRRPPSEAVRGSFEVEVEDVLGGGGPSGFRVIDGGRRSGRFTRPKAGGRDRSRGGFVQRMEQRWQRRRDNGGL